MSDPRYRAPFTGFSRTGCSLGGRVRLQPRDDDQAVRRLIARELEQAGFRVLTAQNGVEALTVLNQGIEIRLVVCDLLMPQLDGYHLAERVVALPNAPEVIFTSAYRSDLELD